MQIESPEIKKLKEEFEKKIKLAREREIKKYSKVGVLFQSRLCENKDFYNSLKELCLSINEGDILKYLDTLDSFIKKETDNHEAH